MNWIRFVITPQEAVFSLPESGRTEAWTAVPLKDFLDIIEKYSGDQLLVALRNASVISRRDATPTGSARAPMPESFTGVGAGKIGFYFEKGTVQRGEVALTSDAIVHPGEGVDLFPEFEVGLWVTSAAKAVAVFPCIEMKWIEDGKTNNCFPGGLRMPGEFLVPVEGVIDSEDLALSATLERADGTVAYAEKDAPFSKLYSAAEIGELTGGVKAVLPHAAGQGFLLASGGLVKPKEASGDKIFLAPGDSIEVTLRAGVETVQFAQEVAS